MSDASESRVSRLPRDERNWLFAAVLSTTLILGPIGLSLFLLAWGAGAIVFKGLRRLPSAGTWLYGAVLHTGASILYLLVAELLAFLSIMQKGAYTWRHLDSVGRELIIGLAPATFAASLTMVWLGFARRWLWLSIAGVVLFALEPFASSWLVAVLR